MGCPPLKLSPQTRGPRTSCPPRQLVLGSHVPLGQLVLGPRVPLRMSCPPWVRGYRIAILSSVAILSNKLIVNFHKTIPDLLGTPDTLQYRSRSPGSGAGESLGTSLASYTLWSVWLARLMAAYHPVCNSSQESFAECCQPCSQALCPTSIARKVALVLNVMGKGGTSCPDRGHLVLGPRIRVGQLVLGPQSSAVTRSQMVRTLCLQLGLGLGLGPGNGIISVFFSSVLKWQRPLCRLSWPFIGSLHLYIYMYIHISFPFAWLLLLFFIFFLYFCLKKGRTIGEGGRSRENT